MRIIGGTYRGKKLFTPSSDNIRPTSDRTREAIFNILRSRLGSNFSQFKLVDLFCGTGAFSLEAISQGFSLVCSVDIDTTLIQKNASLFPNETNKIKIIKADATRKIPTNTKFDVLFMDAPYNKGLSSKALINIIPNLSSGAICLIETHKDETIDLPLNFSVIDKRKYGTAQIIIVQFLGQLS
ncbi:MAG: methyltransferase domain-containing protein [Alphaproteobacteria bacterium]|nr:methyltransferase domain-containing protein [Alphaproteobacteria bacterium]